MKKIWLALIVCFMTGQLLAQEMQWLDSVPKALAKAQKENKWVLLYFTGSDWSTASQVFEQQVLDTPTFNDYAKSNLVLVAINYPLYNQETVHRFNSNYILMQKYGVGIPGLVLLRPDGTEMLNQTSFTSGTGPRALISEIESAKHR